MNLVAKQLFLCTGLTLGLGLSLHARAGQMTSGGGDIEALEFTALGYEVAGYLDSLESKEKIELPGVKASELLATLKNTRVVSEDNLMLDGQPVDAINVPDLKLIRISRGRWNDSIADHEFRYAFVLHEYLGILRQDDARYQITHQFLDLLKKYSFEAAAEINCASFKKLPFSPDVPDDGKLHLNISNRGTFNGLVRFQLAEQKVDAAALMERFSRVATPSVDEMLNFEDGTNRMHFILTLKIPNGLESFDSTAIISDVQNGQRSFLTFELHCKVSK